MAEEENKKIWKVRTVESYSEAHNRLLAGQLLESTDYYVRLNCKTYHFARSVNTPKDIRVGDKRARIGPWNRIEIVNELQPHLIILRPSLPLTKAAR